MRRGLAVTGPDGYIDADTGHADSSTMQLIAAPSTSRATGERVERTVWPRPSVWRVIGMAPQDWPAALADGDTI